MGPWLPGLITCRSASTFLPLSSTILQTSLDSTVASSSVSLDDSCALFLAEMDPRHLQSTAQ